ncbi:MAG TPA: DsbA family oxidoreductase [Steroidobacteraceae bacterium]|nr:DsbA family oxidoreductase [Steroidobacteraceae bacterium]
MVRALRVDVYVDTVCPWCFIGKRRFAGALAARIQHAPRVAWRPFELNPDLPIDGVDRHAYLATRFIDDDTLERAHRNLVDVGHEVGIEFRFDLMKRVPNSRRSHLLVALGARQGRAEEVLERLMHAYFEEGADIGDFATLVGLAAEAGLDEREASRVLALRSGQDAIIAAERHATSLGFTAVPTFVFNGEFALSGAQDTARLVAAIDEAVLPSPAERTHGE